MADKDAILNHPDVSQEAAILIISGCVSVGGVYFKTGDLVLLDAGNAQISATENSRLVLLGGQKFGKVPHINWNFVAYDRETIDAARKRWENGGFPDIPGDNEEFIPLP